VFIYIVVLVGIYIYIGIYIELLFLSGSVLGLVYIYI
jgi:hypothetical protein